jgi:hypothetical protein
MKPPVSLFDSDDDEDNFVKHLSKAKPLSKPRSSSALFNEIEGSSEVLTKNDSKPLSVVTESPKKEPEPVKVASKPALQEVKPKTAKIPAKKAVSLFSDDSDDELFVTKPAPKAASASVKVEEKKEAPAPKAPVEQVEQKIEEPSNATLEVPSNSSFLETSDEHDLFGASCEAKTLNTDIFKSRPKALGRRPSSKRPAKKVE